MQPQESLEVGETRVCVCACGGGEIPTGESWISACVQYECVHTHTNKHTYTEHKMRVTSLLTLPEAHAL